VTCFSGGVTAAASAAVLRFGGGRPSLYGLRVKGLRLGLRGYGLRVNLPLTP